MSTRVLQLAVHRVRVLALMAVAAVLGALLLAPGAGPARSHAATSPKAATQLGEGGLLLAAFNGTATITLSYATGQNGLPSALSGASLPVNTLSLGATLPVAYNSQSGGITPGRALPADVTLGRAVDQYSPAMMQQLYLGAQPTAVITVQRPVQSGQTAAETLRITLTNAVVVADSESHSTTGGTENVSLGFVRITVAYTSVTGTTTQWFYDRNTNTTG